MPGNILLLNVERKLQVYMLPPPLLLAVSAYLQEQADPGAQCAVYSVRHGLARWVAALHSHALVAHQSNSAHCAANVELDCGSCGYSTIVCSQVQMCSN
jgi:hypothetical protein